MKKHFLYIPMVLLVLASCASNEAKDANGVSTVETAESSVQNAKAKVKVQTVGTQMVAQLVEFTANVEANKTNQIAPQSPVRIVDIKAEVGDHVKAGQVLVVMDNSNLTQVKAQLDNQKIEFARVDELFKAGGASKSEWDSKKMNLDVLQASYNNMVENTTLKSPIDGVVSVRNYDKGDLFSAGKPVLVVEQIAPVKILINVNEQYYRFVNKGMKVDIALDALPEETFEGTVSLVYPTLDAMTRTFPVEIKLANANQRVRPGMFSRVTMNFGEQDHVVVPDVAVVKQIGAGDRYVWVLQPNGTVSYNKVELGRRIGNSYELYSGVENGAKVIIAGQNKLIAGMEVEVLQ